MKRGNLLPQCDMLDTRCSFSLRMRTWAFRSQYHSYSIVLLDVIKHIYIRATMRRYERDTRGSFLIQFRTEESRRRLSCLSIKSITHWYGKTCSIQTTGVFFSRYLHCKRPSRCSLHPYTHTETDIHTFPS